MQIFFTDRKTRLQWLILFVWLLMQALLFLKNGIVTDGESRKYIFEAHLLESSGSISNPSYSMYFTQILLIALFNKLGLGLNWVVAIQLLINLIAIFQFHRLVALFTASIAVRFWCTILLVFCYPFQEFNTFLQTESIFFSLSIITSSYILRLQVLSIRSFFALLLLLLLLGITRPTGILMAPPVFLYLFLRFFPSVRLAYKLILLVPASILFFFILNAALGSGGELDFMLPFRQEQIICGVPALDGEVTINQIHNGNSILGLLYYVVNNFDQFARLAWLRSIAFFGLTRSYYSTAHNAFLIVYFYTSYIFVLLSLATWVKTRALPSAYILVVIGITLGTVTLSCDDWHNRFFLSIFPYVLLLGLPAMEVLERKIKPSRS